MGAGELWATIGIIAMPAQNTFPHGIGIGASPFPSSQSAGMECWTAIEGASFAMLACEAGITVPSTKAKSTRRLHKGRSSTIPKMWVPVANNATHMDV